MQATTTGLLFDMRAPYPAAHSVRWASGLRLH